METTRATGENTPVPKTGVHVWDCTAADCSTVLRSSGPSDTLAPPSPYPQQIEPSPTDSNGTESTEIEEEAQDSTAKSPDSAANGDAFEVQSPDIEITSPESAKSVCRSTWDGTKERALIVSGNVTSSQT